MTWAYLAGLLVSVAGLVVLDARLRLFLFAAPRRAAAVLVVAIAAFLLWDAAGVALHVFFEGNRRLLVGIDLAPQIPLEELFFLLLLCLTAMEAFVLAQRLLAPPAGDRTTGRRGLRARILPTAAGTLPGLRRSGVGRRR